MLRSLLFVPGDSERKLAKAEDSGADAVILDLEDSVAPARKAIARAQVAEFLSDHRPGNRTPELWVRINPLDGLHAEADLKAIAAGAPNGIMLPKAEGPVDVQRLSETLDRLETESGLSAGFMKILPIATETAKAPFRLGDYADAHLARLAGLTWGAEDLSSALGASTNRDADGQWLFTYQLVRSLTLLAAHASGVQAIDTLFVDFRDLEGLEKSCQQSRSEGFTGRLAIHPAQVAIINASFQPTDEEIALARQVVAAFAADPDAGVVGIDGRMYDLPHLQQARRVLSLGSVGNRA